MIPSQSLPIKKRAVHFDLVRFIATFIVAELHVATPWLWRDNHIDSGFWITCLSFDTLGRMGVPIFLMISGALLLGKDEGYGSFFKKRFTRVFLPLIFWTIVYEIRIGWGYCLEHPGADFNEVWAVLKNPLKGPVYDHLWFLYMILGMYLVTPFLRRIIPVLKKVDLWYMLSLWIFADIALPLMYNYTDFRLGFNIPMMSAYLGFYVLGYYLMHYEFSAKQIRNTWFIFFAAYIGNIFLVWHDSRSEHTFNPFFLAHHRPGIFIQACSAFILLEHSAQKAFHNYSEKKFKTLAWLGGLTFGIYLLHPLLIEGFETLLLDPYTTAVHAAPLLVIPLVAIMITAITMAIIHIMQRIPFLKKMV